MYVYIPGSRINPCNHRERHDFITSKSNVLQRDCGISIIDIRVLTLSMIIKVVYQSKQKYLREKLTQAKFLYYFPPPPSLFTQFIHSVLNFLNILLKFIEFTHCFSFHEPVCLCLSSVYLYRTIATDVLATFF